MLSKQLCFHGIYFIAVEKGLIFEYAEKKRKQHPRNPPRKGNSACDNRNMERYRLRSFRSWLHFVPGKHFLPKLQLYGEYLFLKDVYEKRQTRLQSHFSKRSHLETEPMVSLMQVGQLKRGFQKYRNGTSMSISYRIATTVTKPKTRKKKTECLSISGIY